MRRPPRHQAASAKGQGSGVRKEFRGGNGTRADSAQGQSERHHPGNRANRTSGRPSARMLAVQVLMDVDQRDAYANLLLPARLREARLSAQDAGLATELVYGCLRWRRLLDAVIERASTRPLERLDHLTLTILRVGVHQVLHLRVPAHAAVAETVTTAKRLGRSQASGFVNAVMRRVSERTQDEWAAQVASSGDAMRDASVRWSHPEWIVRALAKSLAADGRAGELDALLEADDASPVPTLVSLPGVADRDALDLEDCRWSPWASVGPGGDLDELLAAHPGTRVQDEGSQLVAGALAAAEPITAGERWLDACSGPGGKSALLAALGAGRASLTAVEPVVHRAELVRQALAQVSAVDDARVEVADGVAFMHAHVGEFSRILVDAPCTGLGALRRRPEARWRKQPSDLAELTALQRNLLDAALDTVKPGGIVAYVTCSPHLLETREQARAALERHADVREVDAAAALRELAPGLPLGDGAPGAQLWPHVHGTDAMYLCLFRRG